MHIKFEVHTVPLTILTQLAFNAHSPKNLGGQVILTTPLLKNFSVVMSGLPMGTRLSNLKSVSLTTLEHLAFNTPKFRGRRDPTMPPFQKFF